MKVPCVYILASKRNGVLYIGVTSDLHGRMAEHCASSSRRLLNSQAGADALQSVESLAKGAESVSSLSGRSFCQGEEGFALLLVRSLIGAEQLRSGHCVFLQESAEDQLDPDSSGPLKSTELIGYHSPVQAAPRMGPALPSCSSTMQAWVSGVITAVRAKRRLMALPLQVPTGISSRTMLV